MTERMLVVGPGHTVDTQGEPWWDGGDGFGWYRDAEDFAVGRLGPGNGRPCLVIGSPMPEAVRLLSCGWAVYPIDIRKVPDGSHRAMVGDATDMPFYESGIFDAVSSTCVLCHAGLGRYGDPVKPNGDVLMMREVARVLKPGGLAAIMVGPVADWLETSVIFGNVHRIYTEPDVAELVAECGLELQEKARFEAFGMTEGERVPYCYLSILVRKPG